MDDSDVKLGRKEEFWTLCYTSITLLASTVSFKTEGSFVVNGLLQMLQNSIIKFKKQQPITVAHVMPRIKTEM